MSERYELTEGAVKSIRRVVPFGSGFVALDKAALVVVMLQNILEVEELMDDHDIYGVYDDERQVLQFVVKD